MAMLYVDYHRDRSCYHVLAMFCRFFIVVFMYLIKGLKKKETCLYCSRSCFDWERQIGPVLYLLLKSYWHRAKKKQKQKDRILFCGMAV